MAPRENDFPQEALGLHLATLTSRKKADYTDRQIARLDHFIRTNRGFQRFLKAHNDKVTISTLRSFDLTELRVIFGCDGLEGCQTDNGVEVLPILDEKLRSKLAAYWKKFFVLQEQKKAFDMESDSDEDAPPARAASRTRQRSASRTRQRSTTPLALTEGLGSREGSPIVVNNHYYNSGESPTCASFPRRRSRTSSEHRPRTPSSSQPNIAAPTQHHSQSSTETSEDLPALYMKLHLLEAELAAQREEESAQGKGKGRATSRHRSPSQVQFNERTEKATFSDDDDEEDDKSFTYNTDEDDFCFESDHVY